MELKKKQQLEQYYLDTMYSVFINEQKFDIKIGDSIPEDISKLLNKEKSAAILTAWNPKSLSFSLHENKERNDKLNSILKKKNYTLYNALGQGDESWPAEESFFIIGIKKEDAEKITVDFKQYAYVWIEAEEPISLVFSSIWRE